MGAGGPALDGVMWEVADEQRPEWRKGARCVQVLLNILADRSNSKRNSPKAQNSNRASSGQIYGKAKSGHGHSGAAVTEK